MKSPCRRGFTIIEMIITMVIIIIVGYIVADAVNMGIKTYVATDKRKESLDHGRVALDRMSSELRGLLVMNSPVTSAPTSELCFKDVDNIKISFRLSGGNIIRNVGWTSCPPTAGGADSTLATEITALTFTRIQNSVTIDLTATIQGVSSEAVPLRSKVFMRNIY